MKPSLGRIVLYSYQLGVNRDLKPAMVTHVYEDSPLYAVDLEVFGLPFDDPNRYPHGVIAKPEPGPVEENYWFWPPRKGEP